MASVAELEEQLIDVRRRYDEAANAAARAREQHGRLRGLQGLGEASPAEVAEAGVAVSAAQDEADALAHAAEILEERLERARAEEREQRRVELVELGKSAVKSRNAGVRKLIAALDAVRTAFQTVDAADESSAGIREQLAVLQDVAGEERRIRARYADRYEELKRTAPPGQVPNEESLERRLELDLHALRERVREEAEAIAPSGNGHLQAAVDSAADLLPRLIDSNTKQALARGGEFVTTPHGTLPGGYATSAKQRLFADWEMPEAMKRYDEFRDILSRLGGPATSIADEWYGPGTSQVVG